ncbi:regulatory protein RecX [Brevibacterium renqingii]|uniref:regulatory protein RecX n=1 Tax=Brevibacterium renqingii TaxID=2776916 RepID=UPI0020A5BA77|nr:regulatory protein RecX [Brevibacterium renqingii]
MIPQRPRRRMTSKSPDKQSPDDESALAPSQQDGAGEADQTETLSQLRDAISEIDQRHAEGESGFFAGLSEPGETVRTGAGQPGVSKPGRAVEAAGSGWTEGDAGAAPDFADALSFADDDDSDDAPDFDADYAKAKKTAMNMLAMRDHSSDELRKKLIKRELMPEAIDTLIDKLEKSRLLNDEEFAHRFVRAQRESRKLSRSVLKRELAKKGISPELASEAVAEVDGEEELAREVAAKKAASTRRLDYEVRERRILGMLARRGFPSAICIKVTREVLAED